MPEGCCTDQLLIARRDGEVIRRVGLGHVRKLTIGRSSRCELRLQHPSISRRHAILFRHDGQWRVADTGSAAGLRFRSGRARAGWLGDGECVAIGPAFCWLHRAAPVGEPRSIFTDASRTLVDNYVAAPSLDQSVLNVAEPRGARVRRVEIGGLDLVTIGRSAACDLAIDDDSLDPLHAALYREGSRWCIVDAGARSGLHCGGRRYLRKRLGDDVIVRLGDGRLWLSESVTYFHSGAYGVPASAGRLAA